MSIDWTIISTDIIFTGTDEDGVRYLSLFLTDYKAAFNVTSVNAGCRSCVQQYHKQFIQTFSIMSNKHSGFVLKAKYNGIQMKFGSNVYVSNRNMTDELGLALLNDHAAGEKLFDQLPKNLDELQEGSQDAPLTRSEVLDAMTRKKLNVIAEGLELVSEDYKNKALIIEAILDAENAGEGVDA